LFAGLLNGAPHRQFVICVGDEAGVVEAAEILALGLTSSVGRDSDPTTRDQLSTDQKIMEISGR
jgi:hypothetical protein